MDEIVGGVFDAGATKRTPVTGLKLQTNDGSSGGKFIVAKLPVIPAALNTWKLSPSERGPPKLVTTSAPATESVPFTLNCAFVNGTRFSAGAICMIVWVPAFKLRLLLTVSVPKLSPGMSIVPVGSVTGALITPLPPKVVPLAIKRGAGRTPSTSNVPLLNNVPLV